MVDMDLNRLANQYGFDEPDTFDNIMGSFVLSQNAKFMLVETMCKKYNKQTRPVLAGLAAAEIMGMVSPYQSNYIILDGMYQYYARVDAKKLTKGVYMGDVNQDLCTIDVNIEGVEVTCTSPIETIKSLINSIIEFRKYIDDGGATHSPYQEDMINRNAAILEQITAWWYGTHNQSYRGLYLLLNPEQMKMFNEYKEVGLERYNRDKIWYDLMDTLPDPEDSIIN